MRFTWLHLTEMAADTVALLNAALRRSAAA
jgi:hypothetical protein